MATSAAQLKVWKVKKQKLNGKLKALREEEEEFKAMLEVYTQQSTESVNAIISNKNYKEFNEKYEETSSNMDKFINELFSLRMILSENLEGLFGEELDNTSAEEEEDYNTAASYTSTPEIMKSDHPAKLKQIAKNNCCKSLDMQETKIISTDKSDELMTLDTTLSERHPKTPTSITEDFRLESSSPEGNISPNTFKNNIFQLRDSPEFIEKTLIQSSENQTTDSKEISVWSAVDEKKAFSLKSNSSIQSSNFSTEYTTPEAKPIIDNPLSNSTLANFKSQDAKENLQIKENKIWESRELIIGPLEAPKSTCPPVNNSSIQSSNASNVKKVQSASPVAKSIFNNDDSNSTLLNPEAPTFQSTATDKCNLDSSNFLQSPQQPPKGSENLTNHIQISDNLELESFNKPNLHSQNEETLHCASQLVGNESPTNESNNNGMIKTVATVNDTICCSNSNQFSMVPNKQNINKKWKVTITHVNNLVDFYVLCQPELTEKFIEELRTNFVPTEPVILLEKGNWYIASVPYSDPFRACLLDCDENKATVQNIDVGTIYKVNVLYLFDFPTPYYLEIPPAVHCSLYQYSSLVGWDTSDAVEGLQRICQLCPVYAKFYDSQSDDSIMFVELFFSVSGALINFQDYYSELHHAQCSVLHEQSTLTITELPPETTIQVETTARDSSSDRSTPENQLEWRASILPPY